MAGLRTSQEEEWVGHSSRQDIDGWILLHSRGEPYARGFQHGYHLAPELARCLKANRFWANWLTAQDFSLFIATARELFSKWLDRETVDELRGIAAGARAAGVDTDYDEILGWNSFVDLVYSWWPEYKGRTHPSVQRMHRELGHRCSAFIATGSATADGGIVMAHNTWDAFIQGQCFNVIHAIAPEQGQRILMQTAPGWIASMMDWNVNSAGLMVTETTIGGYAGFALDKSPEFYRSRKAVQYATTIDDWASIMTHEHNGGYANSWLLGDAHSGEIARLELGLKYQSPLERLRNGFFCGENIPNDLRIRVLETDDPAQYSDIQGSGARRVRWKGLMEKWHGHIDAKTAMAMIADHYDVYASVDAPSSRTLCGHCDCDDGRLGSNHGHPPNYPWGAMDGKVMTSAQALNMSFHARWGRACGSPFDAATFCRDNPQYDWLQPWLLDRPEQPWSRFAFQE